jgi:hypothetical protein
VQHDGHAEPSQNLERHRRHREDEAVTDDGAKGVVVGEIDVVAQADEALGVADELVGEREPDRAVDRIDDQADDEDEERQQQEDRGAGVASLRVTAGSRDPAPRGGETTPRACRRSP